jgi:hypothetical protein
MERVLKRVKIKTPESRPEMIMPSSKQGVKSKFLRCETVCQPSLSLQIAILVGKFRSSSADLDRAWMICD